MQNSDWLSNVAVLPNLSDHTPDALESVDRSAFLNPFQQRFTLRRVAVSVSIAEINADLFRFGYLVYWRSKPRHQFCDNFTSSRGTTVAVSP